MMGLQLAVIFTLLLNLHAFALANAGHETSAEVEGTVTAVRRYEHNTYIGVMGDDGTEEWIVVNDGYGMAFRINQRVSYSPASSTHYDGSLGRVRTGTTLRIIPPHHDDRVFQGVNKDGSMVFTDNPRTGMETRGETAAKKKKGLRNEKKAAPAPQKEDIIVVEQDELLQEAAMFAEYNRYMEQSEAAKPRKRARSGAKRAKTKRRGEW